MNQIDTNASNRSLNEFKTYSEINPEFRDKAAPYINNGLKTNAPGGWGEFGASSIPKEFNVGMGTKGEVGVGNFKVGFGNEFKVGVGGVGLQEQRLKSQTMNFETFKSMNKALGGERYGPVGNEKAFEMPGGVHGGAILNIESAQQIEGDWPFVVYYGLFYPTKH